MPDLFLELFSEEVPARMQVRGAEELSRLVMQVLSPLSPREPRAYSGPRRIALGLTLHAAMPEQRSTERGPRASAPEQAVAGFLRKHGAVREALRTEGEFLVLDRVQPGVDAATLVAREMPGVLRRMPWPKSMRWGKSRFTWVRPLRRIVCLLDGDVVPFDLRDGEDDVHGLASADQSEGHRFLAPGAFTVASEPHWREELQRRRVIVRHADRRAAIMDGIARALDHAGLTLVEDDGLLDEVAGLVEWPVVHLGRIDDAHMDLPPEVMQVSMRVNQRYFALREAAGRVAPWFAFVANIEADDGGRAIVAGNERVLRARFSDARHFWDLDRARSLASRVESLRAVTFHAKLGTQYDRAKRLERIASELWEAVPGADPSASSRAALLCKADLTTGMVAEFPELQGIMGGYYARHDGEPDDVADAIRLHYAPRGSGDPVPTAPVSIAVALADKLDQLIQFFGIGERPTGSGDPFALRRAALGIIRIVRENALRLRLLPLLGGSTELRDFLFERLRVQLRGEGARHDVLAAVLRDEDDDIVLALKRMEAVAGLLGNDSGADLLAAYRRAANIIRIESAKDGPHDGSYDPHRLVHVAEHALHRTFEAHRLPIVEAMSREQYGEAMQRIATMREPVDHYFDQVTVNDPDQSLRRNRLSTLAALLTVMHDIADFSKIEG